MAIQAFLKRFDTPFARRLGLLVGGSVLGQVIYLLFTPLITRLYTPADFGIFGVFGSLSAILAVVGALRFDMAIPGCKNDDEAAIVFFLALLSTLCVSLALAILLIPFGPWLLRLMNGISLKPYLWLLPFVVFGFTVNQIFINWAVRKQHFGNLTHGKVAQGLGLSLGQAGLGWVGVRPAGLIIGQVAGQLLGALALVPISPFTQVQYRKFWHINNLAAAANKHSAFPRFSVAAALMEAIFGNLPLIYIAAHFGAQPAGLMTLVQRIMVGPMNLISNNIGQVYYSELAAAKPKGKTVLRAIFSSHLKQTLILGLVGFGLAAVFAPFVVPLVFGEAWKDAVVVYWITLPMFLMSFIAGPFGWTLDVLFKQKVHLMRATTRALIVLGVLAIVSLFNLNWLVGLFVISIGVMLVYATYLYTSYEAILNFKKSTDKK